MKKKITIGVFENDSINRFIYKRMVKLQPGKVDAHIFENHEEGIEKVQQLKPDVLFVDLHMHGEYLGGIEWLRTMKLVLPHTRFVAMTTLVQKNDQETALNAGFTMCIEKPLPFYDMERLLKQVSDN
ncbi:MAG: response regulator [Cyclobacteriaceae bacterium]|nr:response regulator [Cyclobacteriaceae bacterium]